MDVWQFLIGVAVGFSGSYILGYVLICWLNKEISRYEKATHEQAEIQTRLFPQIGLPQKELGQPDAGRHSTLVDGMPQTSDGMENPKRPTDL